MRAFHLRMLCAALDVDNDRGDRQLRLAAIVVGALTLNTLSALAFGEEHLRMNIVQLCPRADQTPACITRLRRPRLASALRGRLMGVP